MSSNVETTTYGWYNGYPAYNLDHWDNQTLNPPYAITLSGSQHVSNRHPDAYPAFTNHYELDFPMTSVTFDTAPPPSDDPYCLINGWSEQHTSHHDLNENRCLNNHHSPFDGASTAKHNSYLNTQNTAEPSTTPYISKRRLDYYPTFQSHIPDASHCETSLVPRLVPHVAVTHTPTDNNFHERKGWVGWRYRKPPPPSKLRTAMVPDETDTGDDEEHVHQRPVHQQHPLKNPAHMHEGHSNQEPHQDNLLSLSHQQFDVMTKFVECAAAKHDKHDTPSTLLVLLMAWRMFNAAHEAMLSDQEAQYRHAIEVYDSRYVTSEIRHT